MKALFERLYNLLFDLKEYVLLAVFLVVSTSLLALNNNAQVKHLRSVATVVFGVVQNQLSFIPSYFWLRHENEVLRRLNVELADEAYRLRDAKLENLRLRQLLRLKERLPLPMVSARVVGKNLTLLRNTLTLDAGTSDGLQPSMPVVNESGLVGIVTAATEHFSVVNLLLNTDFRASAKVERSRVDGIIAWDGKSLLLKNVPKTLDVIPGDVVLTSMYSSAFPPDIRIGVVGDVREQPGSLFKSILVVPSVDFVRLEEVFVLTALPLPERTDIEQRPALKR